MIQVTRTYAAVPTDDWSAGVHRVLKDAGVRMVGVVPDAGLARLITFCEADRSMRLVRLTTEEEGVGLLAGAWLGNQRGVLLMQSSGTGNCVNMLSIATACRFPVVMLVTMRGEPGESNPAQVPMGSATQAVLEAMGVRVSRASSAAAVPTLVAAALDRAYDTESPEAVLVAQHVLGFKAFK